VKYKVYKPQSHLWCQSE